MHTAFYLATVPNTYFSFSKQNLLNPFNSKQTMIRIALIAILFISQVLSFPILPSLINPVSVGFEVRKFVRNTLSNIHIQDVYDQFNTTQHYMERVTGSYLEY